jgi:hypothetical protein
MALVETVRIRQGDTDPAVAVILVDANDEPDDLTLAIRVAFYMRSRATGVLVVNNQTATVVNAAQGSVKYALAPGELTEAGSFEAYFRVTFPGSLTLSYPNGAHQHLRVEVAPE